MSDDDGEERPRGELLRLTANVVAAYVGKNSVSSSNIPEILQTVYESLSQVDTDNGEAKQEALRPAVPIKRSVTPDYIVCLEDGKKLKMLKRYLRTVHKMTPEEYRIRWNLPANYPMVAPNYAAQRSDFAKKIGLGRTGAGKIAPPRKLRRARTKSA